MVKQSVLDGVNSSLQMPVFLFSLDEFVNKLHNIKGGRFFDVIINHKGLRNKSEQLSFHMEAERGVPNTNTCRDRVTEQKGLTQE